MLKMLGFVPPQAICRHSKNDPDCGSNRDREMTYVKPAGTSGLKVVESPDAENYEVVDVARFGSNLVLKVKYPNCAKCSYEGVKVLVYLNVTEAQVLRWRKIDPHFTDKKHGLGSEAPSPAARFPASAAGWSDACNYAALKDRTIKIKQMIEIVQEYMGQGLRLTARQLYYQFVARGYIENLVKNYKNLTSLLTDARYAGLIDWNAIEDRGRQPDVPSEWDSIQDLVEGAIHGYRLPRWETQPKYCELWVEKQALAGVLEPMADEFHVVLSVNKGYSSASAMFEAASRFKRRGHGKPKILFYLGDHDPSGEDMVRDIEDRLVEFGVKDLKVVKLALTMPQIEEFNPPPNPAKTTDSRYAKYAEEHGDESWEVDALPPDELQRIIREAFEEEIDEEAMDEVKAKEEKGKDALREAAKEIDDGGE